MSAPTASLLPPSTRYHVNLAPHRSAPSFFPTVPSMARDAPQHASTGLALITLGFQSSSVRSHTPAQFFDPGYFSCLNARSAQHLNVRDARRSSPVKGGHRLLGSRVGLSITESLVFAVKSNQVVKGTGLLSIAASSRKPLLEASSVATPNSRFPSPTTPQGPPKTQKPF